MNAKAVEEAPAILVDGPNATTRKPRLLLAENDDSMRRLLADTLRRGGFEVIEADSGAELVEKLQTLLHLPADGQPIDLIISDIHMPWASGLTVLAGLRRHNRATPVILITAFGDKATHSEAARLGAAVFDKPFSLYDLRSTALRLVGAS